MADGSDSDSRKRERDDEDDQANKRPAGEDSKPIGVYQSGNTVVPRQAAPAVEFSELDSLEGDNKVTVVLEVPDEFVGRIMGKSGQTLRTIQSLSSATVEIPAESEPGSTLRKIRVTGRKYHIKYVNAIFQSKMKVGEEAPIPMPEADQADPANPLVRRIVPVPNDQVGRLIGKQGATIRQLQELSGCYMEVAKECEPGSSMRDVTLIGNQGQATQCEGLIKMKLQGEALPAVPGSYPSEMHLLVPNDMVGRLIGKGGATIRELQDTSGAHMDIAKECAPGSDQREVTLKGTPEQVGFCQQLVQQKCGIPLTVTSSVTNPAYFTSGAGRHGGGGGGGHHFGGGAGGAGNNMHRPNMLPMVRPPMGMAGGAGYGGAGGFQGRGGFPQHQQQPPHHQQQQFAQPQMQHPFHHPQVAQPQMAAPQMAPPQMAAPQMQAPDYAAAYTQAAYAAYGQAAAAGAYGQPAAVVPAAATAATAAQDPHAAWAAYYAQYGYTYDPAAMAAYTAANAAAVARR